MKVVVVVGVAVAGLILAANWPPSGWKILTGLADGMGEQETDAAIAPAEIRVEPISLQCHARVLAEIPVEARREHTILGRTYRTDTLKMVAVGDVDTCVDGDTTTITVTESGATLVEIPASSIRLVRPRVDMVATRESVEVTKGLVGKQTDQFPGVSDDLGLKEEGFAAGQMIIGSSECMTTAVDETIRLIHDAYRAEAIRRGADPETVTVQINGTVAFPPLDLDESGLDWEIGNVACELVNDDQGKDLTEPGERR